MPVDFGVQHVQLFLKRPNMLGLSKKLLSSRGEGSITMGAPYSLNPDFRT